jgi:hypothetical protein
MLKVIETTLNVIGFTVIIIFFSTAVAVVLIGPQGDNSKENVLMTANFLLALTGAFFVTNVVKRCEEHK